MIGKLAAAYVGAELADVLIFRRAARQRGYRNALLKGIELGLPVMVVGAPKAGYVNAKLGTDYGCGDVCVDLVGCSPCPRHIEGRLEDVLPQVPSRSHVIFVSCTLEYVDDLPKCVSELERVAAPGGLFVVHLNPGSSTFFLWPGAKWTLSSAPPSGPWRYRSRA